MWTVEKKDVIRDVLMWSLLVLALMWSYSSKTCDTKILVGLVWGQNTFLGELKAPSS